MSKWLRVDIQASWEKLANALTAMGENVIAANIKSKFVTAVTLPVAEISDNDKTCTLYYSSSISLLLLLMKFSTLKSHAFSLNKLAMI